MKNQIFFLFLFLPFVSFSQDSIKVFFAIEECNRKVKIYIKENIDSVIYEFKTSGISDDFYEVNLLKNRYIFFNNGIKLYFGIKRKYWFGYDKFSVYTDVVNEKKLLTYKSNVHKRRFRYVEIWTNNLTKY